MNVRRMTVAAAFVAILATAGCGGDGAAGGGPGGGFQMPPTPVETVEVRVGRVENVFSTVGTLEAAESVTLVSEIEGTVERLPFQEGEPIVRGALVAQLDDEELDAQYRRAEALRDQRRVTWERVKKVVEADAAAPQDLDDADAALRVSEADATLARVRLGKTRIVAPFAGVVGPRAVSPGAYVRAGDRIAEVAQISELKVEFSMPERYLGDVRRGAEVTVSTTAFPGDSVRGRVDVVDPIVDPATRSVRVIARFDNPGGRLRPGLSADVVLVLSARDSALTVPSEAVFGEGSEFLVYKIGAEGAAERTPVTLGTRSADTVEILSGLAPGDVVVRAGQQKIYPGAKVMPVGEGGSPAGGGPAGGGGPPGTGGPADVSGDAHEGVAGREAPASPSPGDSTRPAGSSP